MYNGLIHADNEHDIKLINACLNVNIDNADEYSRLKDRLHAPYSCKRGTTDKHFLRKQHVVRTY
jgi:hypothetical protein